MNIITLNRSNVKMMIGKIVDHYNTNHFVHEEHYISLTYGERKKILNEAVKKRTVGELRQYLLDAVFKLLSQK